MADEEEDGIFGCTPMDANAMAAWNAEANTWMGQGCMDAQMLPFWEEHTETPEHQTTIRGFRTTACEDFLAGHCAKHANRGKATAPCFRYHFESQIRRSPVDDKSGRLTYWDLPCQAWDGKLGGYCMAADSCCYAHGRDEVSYHPAKYKTRMCNGTDCRGEGVCCFAHGEFELRTWAAEKYSYSAVMALVGGMGARDEGAAAMPAVMGAMGGPDMGGPAGPSQKHRFCASYPAIASCRRGAACAFAHTREEARTPLLALEEENHEPSCMTEFFFTQKFKTLWCPIGAQHDWHSCVYAHTYQDARRKPSIGYGPQPCPYWSKKDTRAAYSQRCPLGIRCAYSHGAKEQLYHPNYFRTVICRDLQVKGCPRRKLCAFFHKRGERRHPPADEIDYTKPIPKDALDAEWQIHFLAPPFFQETGDGMEGGGPPQGLGGGGPSRGPPQQMQWCPRAPQMCGNGGMGHMDMVPMGFIGMDQMGMGMSMGMDPFAMHAAAMMDWSGFNMGNGMDHGCWEDHSSTAKSSGLDRTGDEPSSRTHTTAPGGESGDEVAESLESASTAARGGWGVGPYGGGQDQVVGFPPLHAPYPNGMGSGRG